MSVRIKQTDASLLPLGFWVVFFFFFQMILTNCALTGVDCCRWCPLWKTNGLSSVRSPRLLILLAFVFSHFKLSPTPDANECEMFGSEICKNGQCSNLFSTYTCYCRSGFYYENIRLECVGKCRRHTAIAFMLTLATTRLTW